MLRRRRFQWTAVLAMTAPLAASIAVPRFAWAQEAAPPPPSASPPAPSAAPPPAASPPPAAFGGQGARPRLMAPAPASPAAINPARDQQALAAQGAMRPPDTGEIAGSPQDVFTDDWWGRVRPVVELHGYYRVRGELYQNLGLGRHNSSLQRNDSQNLAPLPLDQSYATPTGGSVPV